MDRISHFETWLEDAGCYIPNKVLSRGIDVPTSHNQISGGVIYIPDDLNGEFLERYTESMKNETTRQTFSEIISKPNFKMFMDLDIKSKEELSKVDRMKIVKNIHETISEYYLEKDKLTCIVCTTHPEVNDGFVKNGMHLIFPDLIVDKEFALKLRYMCVLSLQTKYGENSLCTNMWGDVVDDAVYSNGLRMCGSVKMDKCHSCIPSIQEEKKNMIHELASYRFQNFKEIDIKKTDRFYSDISTLNKSNGLCDITIANLIIEINKRTCRCKGYKRVFGRRYYMPKYVISPQMEVEDLEGEDVYKYISSTSIRTNENDPVTEYDSTKQIRCAPERVTGKKLERMRKAGLETDTGVYGNNEFVVEWSKGEKIDDIGGLYQAIESNLGKLKKHIDSNKTPYKGARVRQVVKVVSKPLASKKRKHIEEPHCVYNIAIYGLESHFCMNKNDYHNSNTSYFIINKQKLKQRCFSKNTYDNVSCNDFSSDSITISKDLFEILYPDLDYLTTCGVTGFDNTRLGKKPIVTLPKKIIR